MLLVVPNFCVQHQHMTRASELALQKLKSNKGTWASFLVNLAEVHLGSGGPLDELLDAINEVITDLENKLERAHVAFDARTDNHHSEVSRIQSLIDSAASDVSATTEYIGVLNMQLSALNQDVINIENAIEANGEATQAAIALRAAQNAEYVVKVPEHQEAIGAIDEALEVLSQLFEGSVSLVQMKSLKRNFETINKKLPSGNDSSILKALMQLASDSKFADQGAVQQVEAIMREVRANLTGALAKLEEDEANQQSQFETDQKNLKNELSRLSTELMDTNDQIATTNQYIVDSQEFLAQRTADKANSEQDLQDENDSYARDQANYEDLVAQFNSELQACSLALDHLNNAEIADYIGDRMDQDHSVIGTNHGMKNLEVETDPFDLE